MNADALLFFNKATWVIPLYEALENALLAACPDTQVRVQKSQISFAAPKLFACASLRGKRFIITFGLDHQVESPRIWQAVEPYPGRWTHHVLLRSPDELDEELMDWLIQAYKYAVRK